MTRNIASASTGKGPVHAATGRISGPLKADAIEAFQDIAVANSADGSVSILINDGNGQFPTAARTVVVGEGTKPSFVELEDLTNDNYKDLLVVASGTEQVMLFMNSKAGGFLPTPTVLPQSFDSPLSAFVGDLNGDSRFDLAIPNTEADNITIILAGPGGVTDPASQVLTVAVGTPSAGKLPAYIAGGHLNPDLNLDLVTPNWEDGTVSILLGNGNGTFHLSQILKAGVNTRAAAIADIDGLDGNDIIVVNQGAPQQSPPIAGNVIIYLNNGDGTFTGRRTLSPGNGPVSVVPIDFDGDNDMDLAAINGGIPEPFSIPAVAGELALFYNNGAGTFPIVDRFPQVGSRPISGACARLDNTQANDLVVANQLDNTVYMVNITFPPILKLYADLNQDLVNDSMDLFSLALLFGKRDPRTRIIGDLNGDGGLSQSDLVSYLSVRRNPVPNPGAAKWVEILDQPPLETSPALADRNGDGVVNINDVMLGFE